MRANVTVTGTRELGWRHIYYESEKTDNGPWYVGACNQDQRHIILRPNVGGFGGETNVLLDGDNAFPTSLHWLIAVVQYVANFGSVEGTVLPRKWINVDKHIDEVAEAFVKRGVDFQGRFMVAFDIDESGNASIKSVERAIQDWPPMFGR